MALNNHVENFTLDMAPGGIAPVLNVSQGDTGRAYTADMYWGGASYDVSGLTVRLRGRKRDNTVFDYALPAPSGTQVSFDLHDKEQVAIIPGNVECELVFTDSDSRVVGTANFTIIVEEAPYDPDAPSESVIPGIEDLIESTIGGDVPAAVESWLDEHPEATTTVQDGAISYRKLDANLKSSVNTIEVNSERIDNLIANAGDGTIPSELVDVRVAVTGRTYPTAGDAVRAQAWQGEQAFFKEETTELVKNKTLNQNTTVGQPINTNTYTDNTNWRCVAIEVNKNDYIILSGAGGNGARLWTFANADGNITRQSAAAASATDLKLYAQEAGYFVFNAQVYTSLPTPSVKHYTPVIYDINELSQTVETNTNAITALSERVFNSKYHIAPGVPGFYNPEGSYSFPEVSYDPSVFTINNLYSMFDALGLEKTHPGNDATNTYYVYAYKHNAGRLSLDWNGKIAAPTLFVVAGIHGDEKSTCIAVYTMMRNIVNRADPLSCYLADNVNVVVIPCANPWGFMNNSRENSKGVNINRNFPDGWTASTDSGAAPLSERESVNIANTLTENGAHMAYVIDYHTTGQTAVVPAINTLAIMTDLAIYPNNQVGYSTLAAANAAEAYVHELDEAYTSSEVCGQLTRDTPAGSFCRYAASLDYNSALLEVTPRLRSETQPYGELSNKLANKLLLETIRNGFMLQ